MVSQSLGSWVPVVLHQRSAGNELTRHLQTEAVRSWADSPAQLTHNHSGSTIIAKLFYQKTIHFSRRISTRLSTQCHSPVERSPAVDIIPVYVSSFPYIHLFQFLIHLLQVIHGGSPACIHGWKITLATSFRQKFNIDPGDTYMYCD